MDNHLAPQKAQGLADVTYSLPMRPRTRRNDDAPSASSFATTVTPDSRKIDRFQLQDLIVGDSNCGLWRAFDERLKRRVSLRVIPRSDPRHDALATAARSAAQVLDRRVAGVIDVIETETELVIVAEWIDGITLEEMLRSPMSVSKSLSITRGVADAVDAIHRAGTTHGRLRPASVMVTDEGEIRLRGHCIDAQVFGIAPGDNAVSADIHGIGAIMTACLTARWPGMPPTSLRSAPMVGGHTATPSQLRADLPPEFDSFCIRSLAAVRGPDTVPSRTPFNSVTAQRTALAAMVEGSPRIHLLTDQSAHNTAHNHNASHDLHPESKHRNAKRAVGTMLGLGIAASLAAVGGVLLLAHDTTKQTTPTSAFARDGQAGVVQNQQASADLSTARPIPLEKILPIASVSAFMPYDGGIVQGGFANYTLDPDPTTAWSTKLFKQSNIPLSSAQGLLVDLGWPRPVSVVEIGLSGNSTGLQIRTSDKLHEQAADFKLRSEVTEAPTALTVREPRAMNARYILVLLTNLPQREFGFQGGIRTIQIRGE